MVISDEKRREIAQELRHYAAYGEGATLSEWWARLHFIATDEDDFPDPRPVLKCLAGLIDRPTCRNVSEHQDVFTCSECRCKVEIIGEECNEYGECFCVPFMPSFCPNCGAEVVDE